MNQHRVVMVLLAVVLAGYGSAIGGGLGAMCGIAIGVLAALQLRTNQRLREIEQQLAQQPDNAPAIVTPGTQPRATPIQPAAPAPVQRAVPAPAAVRTPPPPRQPGRIELGILAVKTYMSTGNVVAKVGVLLLFVGVSFLLKYAVDHNALPIEARLAGTGLGALALLATGWHMRARRAAFGLILQGGGIGILYLTVFAAARLYQVLPLGLSLVVLLALVALSAFLAVAQDSRALATLGTIGGFLAPVLTSTGSGSHVALFSYYAVLNLGIVAIAWFKAWRILNWLGFLFTFVIGAAWGNRYYQPQHFWTTEPFLVLSFFYYLAVSILFAHRHPPKLRGYVDGTLVFGLPLVVFSLQAALVRDIEFGRAWSALGMGLVYIGVARWLWGRGIVHMRMLNESLLALGVVALSLAIPFAFDGHITAAGWALEGAGLIWIGIRQQRPLARAFGSLLQLAAGLAFAAIHSGSGATELAILNTRYLGGLFIACGALLSGFMLYTARAALQRWESWLHLLLLGWGLLWWFGAGLHEIGLHVAPRLETAVILVFLSASVSALAWISERRAYRTAAQLALLWLPALALLVLGQLSDTRYSGPLADWRWLGWVATIVAAWQVLRRGENSCSAAIASLAHALAWWSGLILLAWTANWSIARVEEFAPSWSHVAWGLVPALGMHMLLRHGPRLAWPVQRWPQVYLANAQLPVALLVLLWVLQACTLPGDTYPLPYIPLLNPLELAQAACLLLLLAASPLLQQQSGSFAMRMPPGTVAVLLGGACFLWLNAATARGVHFLGAVPWTVDAMQHSAVFQGAISVLWGVCALAVMVCATRIGQRTLWLTGAALLGLLVLKLFFVDLAGSRTVARIVSFMAAGGLMVLIGYLSPAPPAARTEQAS